MALMVAKLVAPIPMGKKPFHAQLMPSIGMSRRVEVTSPSLLRDARKTIMMEKVAVAGMNWTNAMTIR